MINQPVLWVIHTNKHGSIQLLGQCIVPYEIYYQTDKLYPLTTVFLSSFILTLY